MDEIKGFIKCAHCSGTGTCKNGEKETSCFACKKESKLKNNETTTGLVCSVCLGLGMAEPKSLRIQNRLVPMLALLLVYFALVLIAVFASKDNFPEILAFASTLIGSITGYYFGGKNKTST